MARRHYLLRGLVVSCGMALGVAIVALVMIGGSYDGKCGGFLSALAGPAPCSFPEYVFGNALALALILVTTFWPLLLVLFLIPPCVGYIWDRRAIDPREP